MRKIIIALSAILLFITSCCEELPSDYIIIVRTSPKAWYNLEYPVNNKWKNQIQSTSMQGNSHRTFRYTQNMCKDFFRDATLTRENSSSYSYELFASFHSTVIIDSTEYDLLSLATQGANPNPGIVDIDSVFRYLKATKHPAYHELKSTLDVLQFEIYDGPVVPGK